ncbi:MAG: bifunctional riboflavin kinase/FAD synthetase [Clostridia bacterium]|nr:bifunctional riboflavin kinase/FAD synthetase [Clostridia bacterium]
MNSTIFENRTAIALGFFDGLHLAHMQVIKPVLDAYREKGLVPCVLLFDKHPQSVLSASRVPFLLEDEKRNSILSSLGVKTVFLKFEDIKNLSPEEFIKNILVEKYNVAFVSCGYNYRFGKKAQGDVELLRTLGEEYGFEVSVCENTKLDNESVSSSAIRRAIADGDIIKANKMLGRPFSFSAEVFDGDHRGRLLGAPTINQYLPEGIAVPKFGVYASVAIIDGKEMPSVTNIGNRPTFDGVSVRSETYIIDYSGNLYGKTVEVRLFDFIRAEKKFADANELKVQIVSDARASEEKLQRLKQN